MEHIILICGVDLHHSDRQSLSIRVVESLPFPAAVATIAVYPSTTLMHSSMNMIQPHFREILAMMDV
jgi:hypothetical protein